MNYEETPEFLRDLKRISKKFPSILDDLETVKKNVIELRHVHEKDNLSTFEVPGLDTDKKTFSIWKIKKFACKSLKGRGVKSGIRVIYALFPEKKSVHLLEIYFKGSQKNMDYERTKSFINQNS